MKKIIIYILLIPIILTGYIYFDYIHYKNNDFQRLFEISDHSVRPEYIDESLFRYLLEYFEINPNIEKGSISNCFSDSSLSNFIVKNFFLEKENNILDKFWTCVMLETKFDINQEMEVIFLNSLTWTDSNIDILSAQNSLFVDMLNESWQNEFQLTNNLIIASTSNANGVIVTTENWKEKSKNFAQRLLKEDKMTQEEYDQVIEELKDIELDFDKNYEMMYRR